MADFEHFIYYFERTLIFLITIEFSLIFYFNRKIIWNKRYEIFNVLYKEIINL